MHITHGYLLSNPLELSGLLVHFPINNLQYVFFVCSSFVVVIIKHSCSRLHYNILITLLIDNIFHIYNTFNWKEIVQSHYFTVHKGAAI